LALVLRVGVRYRRHVIGVYPGEEQLSRFINEPMRATGHYRGMRGQHNRTARPLVLVTYDTVMGKIRQTGRTP
jgi:hypothetical protein